MFSKSYSASVAGVDAIIVSIEADVSDGLPIFELVGFLASEVREAKERVRVALKNSGFLIPPKRVIVNLSPADIKKEGTAFDLSIALAVLTAFGIVPQNLIKYVCFLGELSLDGKINPVNGILSMVCAAKKAGLKSCVVPYENLSEGVCIDGINVYGAKSLSEVFLWLTKGELLNDGAEIKKQYVLNDLKLFDYGFDYSEVIGQSSAKRAVEVAAAGMHNILFIGPPGAGKTMLAKRIPTILPLLTMEERIEITKIYSVAGKLDANGLIRKRPFRSPHHTVTHTALAGGGSIPKPGEMSLATKGVLFLDELAEFDRSSIEVLRQPLEDKYIVLSRLNTSYIYPADFMLVAATNPCPCGYYPDRSRCRCSEHKIRNYLGKISQPILDRIDICIEVPEVNYKELDRKVYGESSADIRTRIEAAIQIQKNRYKSDKILFNSQIAGKLFEKYCKLKDKESKYLESAFDKMKLSARAYHRILKVARTIADLNGSEDINCEHISEAVCYRSIDKKSFDI